MIAFPNEFLPTWQIEGLAVYEESAITGEGRQHAGDFRAIVDEAARARALLPLDRVNGGLTRWPGGSAAYAYGLGFQAYLADRFGADTLGELANQTARSVPYFGSLAFRRVFGQPLGGLWRDYTSAMLAAAAPQPSPDAPLRLTHHDYEVVGPRIAPASRGSEASEIYYAVRNADEFPSIYRVAIGQPTPAPPERVTSRVSGSTVGVTASRVYFDQQEATRNAGLYSDLYSLDRNTGRVRRLTSGARVIDPDVSPDGTTIVGARLTPGQRDLVLLTLSSPDRVGSLTTLASEAGTQFNAPRWSPDGRRIVAARQRTGEYPAIVIVDVVTRSTVVVASDSRTRWATPTWHPDGARIIAAAATGDGPFNLVEIDVNTREMRALTHSTGGATWPDLSADGRTIVYVGYSADGFDLYRLEYPARAPATPSTQASPGTTGTPATPGAAASRSYSPWATLAPTSWWPLVETSNDAVIVGGQTSGADVLGYHGYAASFGWRQPIGAGRARGGGTADWTLAYAYTRWMPQLFVSASSHSDLVASQPSGSGVTSSISRQSRVVEGGVQLPVIHTRRSHLFYASYFHAGDVYALSSGDVAVNRAGTRFGYAFRSAHEYGNSISPERGIAAGLTSELVREGLGATAAATTTVADLRLYVPGLSEHHVLAVRWAGGITRGDRIVGRTFALGGGDGNAALLGFDASDTSLLRGFAPNSFGGTHVSLANVEYRLPLARIERGVGTLPGFLHTLHASVFTDLGQVWTSAFASTQLKTSVGAEIAAKLVVGYWSPLTLSVGAARGHDGSHAVPDGTRIYARVGYAF
jgi:Tol biopolymer transport system component